MKKQNLIFICIIIFALLADNFSDNPDVNNKETFGEFKNGEILLPDYVHTDTLIVTNAELLNSEIKKIEPTDAEIYNLLRQGTVIK